MNPCSMFRSCLNKITDKLRNFYTSFVLISRRRKKKLQSVTRETNKEIDKYLDRDEHGKRKLEIIYGNVELRKIVRDRKKT